MKYCDIQKLSRFLMMCPTALGASALAIAGSVMWDAGQVRSAESLSIESSKLLLPRASSPEPESEAALERFLTQADPADESVVPTGSFQALETLENPSLIADVSIGQPSSSGGMSRVTGVGQIDTGRVSDEPMGQVTSISQLSDVQPTDWAFQALQSLVERYGCIAGYPNGTFRGNSSLSRYEFAAGLNACLDRINELIAAGLADLASREDLLILQRLQEEFAAELAALRGRVDALEARTAELEANQFSTTTKLNAVTVFHVTELGFSDDLEREIGARGADGRPLTVQVDDDSQTNFTYLSWMNLTTSFSGEDALNIQFDMSNGQSPANSFVSAGLFNTWGVPFTQQSSGDDIRLRELFYSFPAFDDAVEFVVGPRINIYRHFDGNPYTFILGAIDSFNSSGSTQFASLDRGAGAVAIVPLGDFDFRVGYLAESNEFLNSTAPDPSETRGLFGGVNTLATQVSYSPDPTFNLSLLYARTNNTPPGGAGTVGGALSEPIGGIIDDGVSGGGIGTAAANTYLANFSWRFLPNVAVFGRYSYGDYAIWRPNGGGRIGDVVAQSFQAGLAFPDVGKEGALAAVSYLIPYSYIDGREFLLSGGGDGGVQWELEAAYYYPLTDNIALSPRLYVINNPNNFSDNPTVWVGNLRTQFRF